MVGVVDPVPPAVGVGQQAVQLASTPISKCGTSLRHSRRVSSRQARAPWYIAWSGGRGQSGRASSVQAASLSKCTPSAPISARRRICETMISRHRGKAASQELSDGAVRPMCAVSVPMPQFIIALVPLGRMAWYLCSFLLEPFRRGVHGVHIGEEHDLHAQLVRGGDALSQILPRAQPRVGLVVRILVVVPAAPPAADHYRLDAELGRPAARAGISAYRLQMLPSGSMKTVSCTACDWRYQALCGSRSSKFEMNHPR